MTITVSRTAVPENGVVRYASIGGLELEAGGYLPEVTLAYETWGTLNEDGSNAVLIEHALTGSTHVTRGDSDEPGWWEQLAGPGAPVDTDRFFVVSINIVGGCYGSTGPSSPAPDGQPWGSRFPLVTLRDSTAAEARLADQLGIGSWYAVLGGSMGGARALEWAVTYPDRVERCAVISIGAASTAEQIAFAQAQTLAIRQDANFNDGDYYGGAFLRTGWPWHGGSPTSRTGQPRNSTAGSAGRPRLPKPRCRQRRWGTGAATRWRATWTTRAASSSAALMPTATLPSPRRS